MDKTEAMLPYIDEDDFNSEETAEETPTEITSEEITEETTVGETTEEETPEVAEVQTKVKLKYNHEEKEYSLDEVVPLAQKGMNYDKISQEYQTLKASPVLSYIEKIANANGMTPEQVIDVMQRNDDAAEIEALSERENVPYEIAERLYRTEQKTARIENTLSTDKQTKEEQQKMQQEWLEFEEEYPGIGVKDIAREVIERRDQTGKSLLDCMIWHERKSLKEENTILKQNAINSTKAPVKGVSKNGSDITSTKDDFLEGFDED